MSWLLASPEESLPFILADRGFDVWIANNRGTRWSRRHVSLDPSSRVTTLPHVYAEYLLLVEMLIDFDPFCSSALLELVLGRPGGERPAGHGRLRLQADRAEATLRWALHGTAPTIC
jgi:hypothetical protein